MAPGRARSPEQERELARVREWIPVARDQSPAQAADRSPVEQEATDASRGGGPGLQEDPGLFAHGHGAGANRAEFRSGHDSATTTSGKSDYELVSELAFRIYEQEGCPEGMAEEHWRRAERALERLRLSEPPGGSAGGETKRF
jgi:hypothetical protein